VNVKHRDEGHVHAVGSDPSRTAAAQGGANAQRVLAMTEIDALWQTGRFGGVESRCLGVFIQLEECIVGTGMEEQCLIFAGER
jgi:hypothetical protein